VNRAAMGVLAGMVALLAGCGGAPVAGPDGGGPDFELRVRRDGANVSARADTSAAVLAQRMTIRTPFVYWDERPHPAMPANQHLVLVSVVIEPNGPTWLNDIALQCDVSALGQVWALVGGQRARIYPIDMDGPGAYSYAADLLQAHDGGSGTPTFAQTAETRDGNGAATDYTVQTDTIVTWAFGTAGPAHSLPAYAVGGATRWDANVGMAWAFLVPANATEICIGGSLLGTGSTATSGQIAYGQLSSGCWAGWACDIGARLIYTSLAGARYEPPCGSGLCPYPVIRQAPIGGLSFSWDGTRVAYSQAYAVEPHEEYGEPWIRVNSRTGTGWEVIYRGTSPYLSPDGSMITFERAAASHTSAIWVTEAHALAQPLVVYDDPAAQERWPAWHPNGSCIAFSSDSGGAYRLYTMAPDGTGVAPVGELQGTGPAWSPDGRQLAYARDGWVWVANADGTGERQVTPGGLPMWSPSGLSLLVFRDRGINWSEFGYYGPSSALYCVAVDTGAEELVAEPKQLSYDSEDYPATAILAITAAAWKPVLK